MAKRKKKEKKKTIAWRSIVNYFIEDFIVTRTRSMRSKERRLSLFLSFLEPVSLAENRDATFEISISILLTLKNKT